MARARTDAVDVVVVGAGVAGLAAARKLIEEGLDVIVVEARERVGGRILTTRPPDLPVAIELGAEFVHGVAQPIRELAERHAIAIANIEDSRFQRSGSRIVEVTDYPERLDRVLRHLGAKRESDRSFAEFLSALDGRVSPTDKALARTFIEGFNAADATIASEHWLAEMGSPCEDVRELRVARPIGGYATLVNALASPVTAHLRLGTIATAVRWKRGHVQVETTDASRTRVEVFEGRAAIVTIPIGTLTASPGVLGAIEFDPRPSALDKAIGASVSGHVVKLSLRFDDPFWEDEQFLKRREQPQLDRFGFLQARSPAPFQVAWTSAPIRSPVLVAWAGGPLASKLAECSQGEIEDAALEWLAREFGISGTVLRRRFVESFYHDWIRDPFSLGAYSYVRVGGQSASGHLRRGIGHTIWIAGEAAAEEPGATGTVHGAIESGHHAAKQILRMRSVRARV